MTHYEDIYEVAADNYGIITREEAQEMGICDVELSKFTKRGRLHRIGYGVYRIEYYVPTHYDKYAEAVALVGSDSAIYGESVLAMHGLALMNSTVVTIATPKRVRRTLPPFVRVVRKGDIGRTTRYEGIPSQSVADAIRVCRPSIPKERLIEVVRDAQSKGLLMEAEANRLEEEIEG